ncbi:unnamed protein product [Pieris macdunnoughi]|uniref:Uncharacterized protein n=1 Tax=Pieris macdunnoughi TaxID=345717 RepID=A0A821QHT4_9NEOP|nr:unnamed protein product [Pieris macdunnoughi]
MPNNAEAALCADYSVPVDCVAAGPAPRPSSFHEISAPKVQGLHTHDEDIHPADGIALNFLGVGDDGLFKGMDCFSLSGHDGEVMSFIVMNPELLVFL